MDNKGLNINLPLLSVRRFSSTSSSQKSANQRTESHLPVRPSTDSCKAGSALNPMMNPGSVPFGWEHSPGRPKNEKNKQIQSMENPFSTPKFPPGRFFRSKNIIKPECSKSTKNDSSCSWVDDDEYDNDNAYMDAVSTLSRGETSGVLGAESKTWDFMLGRFLPAARAMASDATQHTFKKLAINEKPEEDKKLVMDDSHDKEDKDDDYDSDYEFNEHGKKSSKFCGLIPRFCTLSPVHGMSVRAKLPISPASRTQDSSSSSSSFRETNSEPARSGVYKHRSTSTVLKSGFIEPANIEGSKLYSHLQGPAISVDLSGSIQSTVSEQSDSSSKKKGVSFKELLADKNSNEITETSSQDSIIEKTLYVDIVHIAESPKENAGSSCTKPQSSFNESLESENDKSKHDMKTRKNKDLDHDAELYWFDDDDPKRNLKLKAYDTRLFGHVAPPPLPKSPSDSWLCRTLPSASSKKAPAYWIPIYRSSNTVADDPKTDENIQLQSPQEQRSPMSES